MESRNASGTVNGASGSWRHADNVVSTESTVGRDHERFHDEFKSPGNVGLSHGIPSVTNASAALSWLPVKATQSSKKREIEQKVQNGFAVAQSEI